MPTRLGNPYSPLWRGAYPHMLKEDYPIWNRFLNANFPKFQRIYYDVRVGGVFATDPPLTQKEREMFYMNTAKRIDALAELEKELWLIEVASRPGLRAVGQLMTYLALWLEDPAINKATIPTLVVDAIDEDMERALTLYGVQKIYTL